MRDQDISLLKKGAKERREMEKELGKEGQRKELGHMVIVKLLWWGLEEHMLAPEVMAHRLLRSTVEHLQERMTCRGTQLEARAEDMGPLGYQDSRDGADQVQDAGHHDGFVAPARMATAAARKRGRCGRTSGR